ncbi:MAG: ABC transporter permease subunit [Syntrophotaleaceae bacterium]
MNPKYFKRAQRNDRIARRIITLGGMAVIFSVILILFLIAKVTFPLFSAPKIQEATFFSLTDSEGEATLAAAVDDYLENAVLLKRSGLFAFYDPREGRLVQKIAVEPPVAGATVAEVEKTAPLRFNLLWSNGTSTLEEVSFTASFGDQGKRTFEPRVTRLGYWEPLSRQTAGRVLVRSDDEGSQVRVSLLPDHSLRVEQQATTTSLFGETEVEEEVSILQGPPREGITALALNRDGSTLYAGTDRGTLLRWDLSEPGDPILLDRLPAFSDQRGITALSLMLGEISLAVGDSRGGVTTWFPVASPASGGVKRLQLIHTLQDHDSPVETLIPSQREKSLFSVDRNGTVHLDHMTSERHLLTLFSGKSLKHLAVSGRGTGLLTVDSSGRATTWWLHNPHPEVSWRTLFGKVWYENYDEPVFAWQSSSASDDFEPKLSLTPLIFGTIKGTCYAMLFAIPLALFGAIYTSQFGNDRLRGMIKPAVEIMAAIPSVIIGFLAALWFAPLLEKSVPALFVSILLVPTFLLAAIVAWQMLEKRPFFRRLGRGHEFLLLAPVLIAAVACAVFLGPVFENWLFDGNFKLWLFGDMGVRYDPRNNIVIAFALGFAVIPIIFTIAEDSLSNVPHSLKAASLALGASRWQTVWRIILPSASPGIFAGTMIGLGRAIGETMIVLMATGNTPIMDWSIFNGMRPLSSNIAVEIPEAPHGGTLYRVLFLSAVLLFMMTFILNTVAELVRQRLRKKYGRF